MNGKFTVIKIKMAQDEAQKIIDAIYYGTRAAAQHMYKFYRSTYDEDAGVYTDYSQNDPARTWANVNFQELCANAILDVQWSEQENDPVYVTFLNMSIGAVVQLLWCISSNEDLQRSIWKSRAQGDWESDGHYGNQSKQDFIKERIHQCWMDRKQGLKIATLLQDEYSKNHERLEGLLIVGKTPRDIRKQLVGSEHWRTK